MSRRSAKAAARDLPLPPTAAPTWLRPAILALAALLLIGWFVSPVANPDTWWHLESGRYIWQTHHLPSPDPFAYTTASARPAYPAEPTVRDFNLTHEWLAQLIFYFGWAIAGAPGLILLRGDPEAAGGRSRSAGAAAYCATGHEEEVAELSSQPVGKLPDPRPTP